MVVNISWTSKILPQRILRSVQQMFSTTKPSKRRSLSFDVSRASESLRESKAYFNIFFPVPF